jgi:hypothetical protein
MKIHLTDSWTVTDEHPITFKGKPVLLDLATWKAYQRRDVIGAISASQVVSLLVEEMGKNNFLPEELQFISRFNDVEPASQPV